MIYFPTGWSGGAGQVCPGPPEDEPPRQHNQQAEVTQQGLPDDQTQGHEQEEETLLPRQTGNHDNAFLIARYVLVEKPYGLKTGNWKSY